MAIQLDDLVARLRLDSSGLSSGLSSVSSSLGSVGAKATSAGKSLSVGLTAPIVGIGIASTKLAAGFDKTMRQVAIATGGPSKALGDLAMKMGADTAFSAGEAADAMLELAKGGMTAAQIEGGALAATMKLASAGGIGLADSSTYVSNAMAMFGLSAKSADKVTVALAGAANASSASVESLGMGLSQVGGIAASAGMSLQETVGALSAFDAQGLKGSDAGTSLKSMLNQLIPTTDKAKAAMEGLGLDFVKGNGEFESMTNIAGQLQAKLGGLSEAERSLALETMFGSDGMRAANAAMNAGAEGMAGYIKASKDAKTTTELANAAMEGTSGAMERASGSIETAMLTLGQQLAPYVEKAAAVVEDLANRFTALPDSMKGSVVIFGGLAALLGPLLIVLGMAASGLGVVAGALAAVSLPVLAVVVGVGALVAALVVAYQRSEAFRLVVSNALQSVASFMTSSVVPAALRIREAFMNLVATVTPIVQQIVGVVRAQLPQIQATVASVFGSVKSIVMSAMSIVRSVITIATAVIRAVWSTFGQTILSTISRVLSSVQGVIRGAFAVIKGIFQTVSAVLRGDWSAAWNGIKTIVGGALDVIKGLVSGAFALLRGMVSALGAALSALMSAAWNAVKAAVSAGIDRVVATAKTVKGKITGALSGAGTWLTDIGRNIIEGLGAGIDAAREWLRTKIDDLAGWIPGWIKDKLGIRSPSRVMAEIGRFIGAGLVKGLGDSQQGVVDKMNKLIELLNEAKRKGLAKLAKSTRTALIPLARELEAMRDRIADAKALRDDVASNVAATGTFEGVRGQTATREITETDPDTGETTTRTEEYELPITAADVIAAREAAAARAAEFAAVLEQLRVAGLSQPQLDELARMGPQALEVARATLAGGAQAIAALNALQARIIASGQIIGTTAATNMYGAGVDTSKGLIAGLESQEGAIVEAMRKLARKMVRTLRKELKMRSPSKVMEGLGVFTGQGFANGIDTTVRAVERASSRIADAALINPQTFTPDAGAISLAARRAARDTLAAPAPVAVRVFIGDRELTDIVRVEMTEAVRPLATAIRKGA